MFSICTRFKDLLAVLREDLSRLCALTEKVGEQICSCVGRTRASQSGSLSRETMLARHILQSHQGFADLRNSVEDHAVWRVQVGCHIRREYFVETIVDMIVNENWELVDGVKDRVQGSRLIIRRKCREAVKRHQEEREE